MQTIHGADVITLRTKGTTSEINLYLFFFFFKQYSIRGTDLQTMLTTDAFLFFIDDPAAEPLGGPNRRVHQYLPILNVFEKSCRRGRDIFPWMFICERFLEHLRKQLRNHRVSHGCILRVLSRLN